MKRLLPESHTDFVFAVGAEEFGIVLCLMLLALFAFIVIRTLRHAIASEEPFIRFAAAGLAILFGLQSAINMAVNLHLIPAKGMTLPFVSYGGSSMISLAYGMGMLLALTRDRPRAELLAKRDLDWRQPGLIRPALAANRCASAGKALTTGMTANHDSAPAAGEALPSVLVAAGGTGGHLFPAEALAAALAKRNIAVALATDARAARHAGAFAAAGVHIIPSATIRGRNPISLAKTGVLLGLRRAEGLADAAEDQAHRGRGLRRLSEHPAAARGRRCAASRP